MLYEAEKVKDICDYYKESEFIGRVLAKVILDKRCGEWHRPYGYYTNDSKRIIAVRNQSLSMMRIFNDRRFLASADDVENLVGGL
jgi:hypothetical protein